jgi:polysaccharide export outer membrane protein
MKRKPFHRLAPLLLVLVPLLNGQLSVPASSTADPDQNGPTYVLGPNDELSIWALGITDFSDKPVRVDPNGYLDLPLVGRVRVAGLTIEQFKTELTEMLHSYVRQPQVSVRMTDSRSQPVSVLGAVRNPGIVQLQGTKNLTEVLSLAGGLSPDAGDQVKLTRSLRYGKIPLPDAKVDPEGEFNIAQVSLRSIMQARSPEENIQILGHDVITIPRADMVYVIGEVGKSGGFPLQEKEGISVLQALSLAGGVSRFAALSSTRILRASADGGSRIEIPLDLKRLLSGKRDDVQMKPGDILFIPNSLSKNASLRAIETAIQLGTGLAVFRYR